jgi:hypothetical protein
LSPAEIQTLGPPSDLGIFVQTLPALFIAREGADLQLHWRGGAGIHLQHSPTLAPSNWNDLPATQGASNFSEPLGPNARFYRLAR